MDVSYTARERAWLWLLAAAGAIGLNGAFLYGTFVRPGLLASALANPVALAFIVEALVLTGVLAWLLDKWGVSRLSWPWFVGLSLAGGIAFALPLAILWTGRKAGAASPRSARARPRRGEIR